MSATVQVILLADYSLWPFHYNLLTATLVGNAVRVDSPRDPCLPQWVFYLVE